MAMEKGRILEQVYGALTISTSSISVAATGGLPRTLLRTWLPVTYLRRDTIKSKAGIKSKGFDYARLG